MLNELCAEPSELERAAFERPQDKRSLAATQIYNLGTEPRGQAELVREPRVVNRLRKRRMYVEAGASSTTFRLFRAPLPEPVADAPDVFSEQDRTELGELVGAVVEYAHDRLPIVDFERDPVVVGEPVEHPDGCLGFTGQDEPMCAISSIA